MGLAIGLEEENRVAQLVVVAALVSEFWAGEHVEGREKIGSFLGQQNLVVDDALSLRNATSSRAFMIYLNYPCLIYDTYLSFNDLIFFLFLWYASQ